MEVYPLDNSLLMGVPKFYCLLALDTLKMDCYLSFGNKKGAGK
jgi:hypothetical protein